MAQFTSQLDDVIYDVKVIDNPSIQQLLSIPGLI